MQPLSGTTEMQFIGQPLFVREGGGSNLADAGQLFASVLSDGLAQIAAHYNLYAVWPHGQAERVAPVVEVIKQLALHTPS
ncbi:hypothetical protein [Pseudomonas sp. NPDC087614]|uniref:hypothetical protein n=1 Tax=Pseudomonas sp. NPDC087614 TaxID=3364442 RepID=UPI0038181971